MLHEPRDIETLTLIERAENMPVSRDSLWNKRLIQEAIAFLMNLGMVTQGEKCLNMACALQVARDGYAQPQHNCDSCETVAARYPVFCDDCASKVTATTPQKMILRLNNPQATAAEPYMWAAAYYSFAFIPFRMQQTNSLEACENILDMLTDEASVSALIETLEATTPTNEEKERGN